MKELHVIIHNLRSAYNVGAIFRTADGAGVAKIHLTGYTPRPFAPQTDPYMTVAQKMIAKTALGAEQTIPWDNEPDIALVIARLRQKKFQLIGLEENVSRSQPYNSFPPVFPGALIVGNEVSGIDKQTLDQCDAVISIPMRGKKESLNVSVAAGIAIYELLK